MQAIEKANHAKNIARTFVPIGTCGTDMLRKTPTGIKICFVKFLGPKISK